MEPQGTRKAPTYATKRVKHYVFSIKDFLGRGNFSNVYRGLNEQTNEPVAIKVKSLEPLKDPKLNQLHRSQINVLLSLNHPNIIKTYDIVEEGNQCFIVSELCQGGDLDMYVKKKGFLDEDTAAGFIKDVLEGLLYLASMNIVHRDIKVANVFLRGSTAKIADFGFAVFSKENFRDANIGSPHYMSPQSFIHCVYGTKSDVWSFGLLIYQLFHGSSPYSTCVFEQDLKRQLSIPFNKTKIRPTLSTDLKEVIYCCLEIDDTKRISFQELRQMSYFRRIYGQCGAINHEENSLAQTQRSGVLDRDNRQFYRFGSIERQSYAQKGLKLKINFSRSPRADELRQKTQFSTQANNSQQSKPRNNNLLSTNQQTHQNLATTRPVSNWKRIDHLPSPEPQRARIFSRDSRRPTERYMIISTTITFKVAVTFLHYCRCVYHYIQLLISFGAQRTDIQFMSNWLLLLLEELKIKMNEDGIIFDGKNKKVKIDKFREVRTDYERRYSNQLKEYTQNFNNKATIEQIKAFMLGKYKQYDQVISKQNQSELLEVGIFNVLIFDATRILKICHQQKNYNRLDKYKDLEQALTLSSQNFNSTVYGQFKKRVIAH